MTKNLSANRLQFGGIIISECLDQVNPVVIKTEDWTMLNFSAGLAMLASPAHTYSLSLIGAQKNTLPGPAGSCTSASISQEQGAPVYQGPGGRWPAAPRCRALTSLQVGDWATSWESGHVLVPGWPWRAACHFPLPHTLLSPGSPPCSSACFPVNLVAPSPPKRLFIFFHEEEEGYKVAKVGLTVKEPELLSCTDFWQATWQLYACFHS